MSSSEIIQVFDVGIILNEKFRKLVGEGESEEYRKLRKEIEQYDEKMVMPCVRRASQLIEKKSDLALLHELMKLVISHENSSDETISYAMGKIFAANPLAVERTMKDFSPAKRILIINSIQVGWGNVKREVSPKLGRKRDEQLQKLLASVAK